MICVNFQRNSISTYDFTNKYFSNSLYSHIIESPIYLGVMLDTRLNFKAHVEYAAAKARVANALARLMPNIGGHRQPRRKILASVVTSILTYGIAIWGKALEIE